MEDKDYSIMFTIESWYVLMPIAIIAFIALIIWGKRQKGQVNLMQYMLLLTFGIYLLCMSHLVFFPIDVNLGKYANQIPWYRTINFIPILTIDLKTFLLNIIMLIPFGMYLPFLGKTYTIKQIAKRGLVLSLSIELTQLLIRGTLGSGRSTDINDLLANTLGAVIGFLIVQSILKVQPIKHVLTKFQLSR